MTRLPRRPPSTPLPPDPSHLRDPSFLVRALRYRTARLLHTLAARLRKHSRRLGDFGAWNKCLMHVLVSPAATEKCFPGGRDVAQPQGRRCS